MPDDDSGRGTRRHRVAMMFRKPKALEPERLGVPGERDRLMERITLCLAGADLA
jgi:hypothetical protein